MITGRVVALNILLPVTFRFGNGTEQTFEFVADTGFTGALTLSAEDATALGLRFVRNIVAQLANDEEDEIPAYEATIIWNNTIQRVAVLATGSRPLIGTSLLDGKRMTVEFAENGLVTLDDL